jgi:hypothetical protein
VISSRVRRDGTLVIRFRINAALRRSMRLHENGARKFFNEAMRGDALRFPGVEAQTVDGKTLVVTHSFERAARQLAEQRRLALKTSAARRRAVKPR